VNQMFELLLLSPALSSIPNGGEGVAACAIRVARRFESGNARPIPSPRSEARGESQGEGFPSSPKLGFSISS
jgi:hypothetical protein